jgi:hypothetical protein
MALVKRRDGKGIIEDKDYADIYIVMLSTKLIR